MKAPCLNCADRKISCHSSCTQYNLFREERELIAKKRRQFNDLWPDTSVKRNGITRKFNYHTTL